MARVRQARWEGVREKPVSKSPSRRDHQLKSGRYGLGSSAHPYNQRGTPRPVYVVGREATPKACGVSVAKLQGYSWTPNLSTVQGERGNHPDGPYSAILPTGRPAVG